MRRMQLAQPVLHARDGARQRTRLARLGQRQVFGPHAHLQRALGQVACSGRVQGLASHPQATVFHLRGQEVHARRADEMPNEHMLRALEQRIGRAQLHDLAPAHHHHLVREGERFHLIVRDIDQRELELVVDLLELAPQLPLEVRIDHGERLVKQHGRDVGAHQAAPQRDLLLLVGRQARRAHVELVAHLQHLGDNSDTLADPLLGHLAVLERERQVLGHGHGVVDHRELEDLRDVAVLRRGARDIAPIEQHLAVRGHEQPRHDVEHGRLAAARRAEQRVSAAILEFHLQGQQRVVAVLPGIGLVGMRQVERDVRHAQTPERWGASSRPPSAPNT